MMQWRSRLTHNPLVAPAVARWRGFWKATLAIVALLALIACGVTLAGWVALIEGTPGAQSPSSYVVLIFFAIQATVLLIGLAWLAVLLMIPAVAATSVSRARESGMWDEMRLTLLTAADIIDGFFVRTLVRYPFWVLVLPAFPFVSASANSAISLMFVGGLSGEGLSKDSLLPGAVLLAANALLQTIHPLLQLASGAMLGIAAGAAAQSRNGALAWTFGALVVFEWIVPGVCGGTVALVLNLILAIPFISTATLEALFFPPMIAAIVSGLLLMIYQCVLFFAARAFARARAERGAEG